ncbi:MAG: PDZ domain-containing protein [Planctomycetota bacterium]|jgi:hypothetical protein
MTCTNTIPSCFALATVAALATATLDAAAVAGGDKDQETISSTIVISGDELSFSPDMHTFEIMVDNGKITVTIDGDELPASRYQAEDGRLVILDEDGNEVKSFDVLLGRGRDDFHLTWQGAEPFIDIEKVFPGGMPKVMIGVHLSPPSEALQYHLKLDEGATTMISGLYKGLAAQKAGIERFDIIVAVDGVQPAAPNNIMETLAGKEPGDEVTFTVIHKGRTREYSVTLDAFDAAKMDPSQLIGGGRFSNRIFIPGEGEIQFMPGNDLDLNQFFVDPKSRQRYKRFESFGLPEGFDEDLRRELGQRIPRDLDERMAGLNERIEELQEMIARLVEQAQGLAEESDER